MGGSGWLGTSLLDQAPQRWQLPGGRAPAAELIVAGFDPLLGKRRIAPPLPTCHEDEPSFREIAADVRAEQLELSALGARSRMASSIGAAAPVTALGDHLRDGPRSAMLVAKLS